MSDDWMTVRTVGTEEEAAVLAGFLESRGLPVVVDSRLFRQEPVTFGHLARIEVKVPRDHHARARELLEQGAASLDRSTAEDE